jgi:hypothetical protein
LWPQAFLSCLATVYLFSFLSLLLQWQPMLGANGLAPAGAHMAVLAERVVGSPEYRCGQAVGARQLLRPCNLHTQSFWARQGMACCSTSWRSRPAV